MRISPSGSSPSSGRTEATALKSLPLHETGATSVAGWRRLAEQAPQAYRPDLALALSNLALFHDQTGVEDEAIVAAQEAVDLRRQLAREQPQDQEQQLAGDLYTLGAILLDRGAAREAAAALGEACHRLRAVTRDIPEPWTDWLTLFEERFREARVAADALDESGKPAERSPPSTAPQDGGTGGG